MEYQKLIYLLDNTPNQPTQFRTKNWVEINDNSRGTCSTGSYFEFKISMIKSSPCDYSDVYILVRGTMTVSNTGTAANPNTDCISEINNTEIDNDKDIM